MAKLPQRGTTRDPAKTPASRGAPRAARGTTRTRSGATPKRSGAGEIAGVRLTHPERVLWEEQGLTKQQLAEYYLAIAEWILPHVVGRPLALVRCPSGAEKGCFFQKHPWAGLDRHVIREAVPDEKGEQSVVLVRDIGGVIGLAQAGVLEIHPWGAPLADIEHP